MISAQTNHTLAIEVSGIKHVKGKVGVCLVEKEDEFLGNCANYKEVVVTSKTATITFNNLSAGSYAVTIHHDANQNGKLDTNFIGLPKERYGFSNNPSTRFGPPSYKKCLFELMNSEKIQVRLR